MKKNYYKRTRRRRVTWLSVVTWCAVASTVLLVLSVIPLVSPALFMVVVVERLPRAWQDALFMDFLMRGGSGFWEFLVLTFVLWALRSHLAER